MSTQVFEIMQRNVLVLAAMTTVAEATQLLTEAKLSSGPVLDANGEYIGVVSCRDLLAFSSGPGNNPRATRVWEILYSKHQTIPPTLTIKEAAKVMATHNQHRLYVLDDKELIGIISSFDVTKVYADEDTVSKAA